MTWVKLALLALITQAASRPPRYDQCLSSGRVQARWELPPEWREVSGLALSADGRLFLHGDETGRIGMLDASTGEWLGAFELGSRSPAGDFEDIAIVGSDLYLITSTGRLHRTPVPSKGRTGGPLAYAAFETRADRWCEIEGLGYDPAERVLLLGCKEMKGSGWTGPAVLRWSVDEQRLATPDHVVLRGSAPIPFGAESSFRPSAVAVDTAAGRWVVISSADSRVVIADRRGRILASASLPKRHRQPEGLALGDSGIVYVSDEGGKGLGSVSVYACR